MLEGRKRKAYLEPRKKSLKIFLYPSCCIGERLRWEGALSSRAGGTGGAGWPKVPGQWEAGASACSICLLTEVPLLINEACERRAGPCG